MKLLLFLGISLLKLLYVRCCAPRPPPLVEKLCDFFIFIFEVRMLLKAVAGFLLFFICNSSPSSSSSSLSSFSTSSSFSESEFKLTIFDLPF